MRQRILAGIILSLMAATSIAASISGQGTWETTLQGRLPITPGGTDYQAYYDTDLNITWLADANLAATNTFGEPLCPSPQRYGLFCVGVDLYAGSMGWDLAQTWVAAMNSANYLGVNNWRLPTITDTGTPGCNFAYTGTDCGYNVDLSTSEMAHMFYSTLGNRGWFDTHGGTGGCSHGAPWFDCLTNTGPFSNIQNGDPYWSGTTYATDSAWFFYFVLGSQDIRKLSVGIPLWAWAVRPGDIGTVPVPAVGWLLGPAFAVLGSVRRRRSLT